VLFCWLLVLILALMSRHSGAVAVLLGVGCVLVGGCWRGVVAGAGRGHKVGSVWEQEQQQQQQQSKQGGHVQEHNKREWIFGHGNFRGAKRSGVIIAPIRL